MSSLNDLAEAVAAAADALQDPSRLDDTLQAILAAAADSVKGFDQASLSTCDGPGRLVQRVAHGDLASRLDALQVRLAEGPAVEVVDGPASAVVVRNLRHEQRWPGYVPQAVQLGAVAQISARVRFDDTAVLGSLNLYAAAEAEIDDEAESLAEVFAAQAAVAMGGAAVITQLTTALSSRKLIGQALGILMERYSLDEARALAYLRRESSHRNVKVRDLAAEVVAQREATGDGQLPPGGGS